MGCGSSTVADGAQGRDQAAVRSPPSDHRPASRTAHAEEGAVGVQELGPAAHGERLQERGPAVSKMDLDLLLQVGRDTLRLQFWDFGGQDTFYGLYPMYITRAGVYMVVFNMQWLLPAIDGNAQRHRCSACNGNAEHHLEFLEFWLNNIALHAVDPEDGIDPGSLPAIVLAGTHKDQVPDLLDQEKISDLLNERLSHLVAWGRVIRCEVAQGASGKSTSYYWALDNPRGLEDPMCVELQRKVGGVVGEEKYVQYEVPFVWLKALERMQTEVNSDGVVELDDVHVLAREVGMMPVDADGAAEEEAVRAMLRLFNNLGQVTFHEEDALNRFVIMNPAEFLVAPASRVMCQVSHRTHP